ncbi:SAM-dependent methyltransferase [Streptomyces sp. SID3343]|uniref:SAM-dependent methyltransferase n=1 Tax=Streptomyces sp. SID3343 TaxID=2690260 RepID=UPI00136D1E22|nr:SAM-dependent methyltransferase [Streptomyces sp. SID3343]MYW04049.1 SAM-dependent methyltransferase [Streptomyces sp. SID3343]
MSEPDANQSQQTERAPAGIDVNVPSVARIYDFLIGGKDNYAADREVARKLVEVVPGLETDSAAHRAILHRGVRFLVEQGVRQFVDLGSGLPTAQNTHQVAQGIAPETNVVYVDNDPIVLAHGRALLAENNRTTVITADLREPKSVLEHPDLLRLIDFDEPIGLMLLGVIHHINDDEDPAGLLRTYLDALPSGSWLFLTHFLHSGPESEKLERVMQGSHSSGRFRERDEIAAYFEGLETVDPGLVHIAMWRPEEPVDEASLTVEQRLVVGAIARKP